MEKKSQTPSINILPENLRDQYEIAPGVLQCFADHEHGMVDLTKISEDLAKQLAVKGYLIKNEKKSSTS